MSGVVKAVAYVRVSTDDQDPKGQSLVLENYATERGYKIVEWFRDEGVSGSVDPLQRPGFRALLDYVFQFS
jgi:DNA invertase Pin-like site-specific DNA recombinase